MKTKQYSKKTSMTKNLHYSMFVPNEQIAKDNASHAFGKPLGSPIGNMPTWKPSGFDTIADLGHNVSPGVLGLRTVLSIGNTSDGFNAPINKACRALYAKYWAKNSSISKFQEMDIGIYTFASAQIVAIYSWLCAVYAACFTQDVTNQYTRSGVLAALGVSPKDITTHTTDLRGFINQLTIDMAGFNLDSSIPLYNYAASMYSNFLKDESSYAKTQYYVSAPAKVLTYEKASADVGSLKYVDFLPTDGTTLTYNDIITKVNAVVSAFVSSYYIADISAAIQKCVESSVYTLSMISEDFRIEFVYDEVALTRIKNATVVKADYQPITQDVISRTLNTAVYTRTYSIANSKDVGESLAISEPPVIHAISPASATPDNVVVLGSLTAAWKYAETNAESWRFSLYAGGFEVVDAMVIVSFMNNGQLGITDGYTAVVAWVSNGTEINGLQNIMRATWIAKEFDYFPNLRMYFVNDLGASVDRVNVMDSDYSDVFSENDLFKLHRASIQTILGVPDKL